MKTWGVDLSTNANNVGLVSITWPGAGGAGMFECHSSERRTTSALVDQMSRTAHDDWWAVDVPFGWPDDFAGYLLAHRDGPAPLPSTVESGTPWSGLARRETDRLLIGVPPTGQRVAGFSVAFDKLGATAAAWANIEWLLYSKHQMTVDRSGVSDNIRIFETYPAAQWRRWRAKGNPASAGWRGLAELLTGIVTPSGGDWDLPANPHECDALVCALVARARAQGSTQLPNSEQRARAAREGWIHVLSDSTSLASLLEPIIPFGVSFDPGTDLGLDPPKSRGGLAED